MVTITQPSESSTEPLLDALTPRAREIFEASQDASAAHSALSRAHHDRAMELRAEMGPAHHELRKMQDHPQATKKHVETAEKAVAKVAAKTAKHETKKPIDRSSWSLLLEDTGNRSKIGVALQKWLSGGADLAASPLRDAERVPDTGEPDTHPEAVRHYGAALKQIDADVAALQGRVLPKQMVAEKIRADFRKLLGGDVPAVGATRRLAKGHRPDNKLAQGSVRWPTVSRLVAVRDGKNVYIEETDRAQLILWALRDTVEDALVAAACDFDDSDELDLQTRDQKLAALEAERIRLTRNAEHHLALSNGAAERNWKFCALCFLGIEVA